MARTKTDQSALFPDSQTGGGFQLKTKSGYELNQVRSALQKEIRRCNEMRAMFWAYELMPKYVGYLFRTLFVIASEELPWDDNQGVGVVSDCWNGVQAFQKEKKPVDMHLVARPILYLSRAKKSREVNDYFAVVHHYADDMHKMGERLPMADYAIDGHTDKRLNKLKTWWEYSRRIFNHAMKPNRYFKAIFEYEGSPYPTEWAKNEIEMYDKLNEEHKLPTQPFNGAEQEGK